MTFEPIEAQVHFCFSLTITNVQRGKEGIYRCEATVAGFTPVYQNRTLIVRGNQPTFSSCKFKFAIKFPLLKDLQELFYQENLRLQREPL